MINIKKAKRKRKRGRRMKTENRCLGCGIKLEIGEVCYKCLSSGIAITEIYSKTGRVIVTGADGKKYAIYFDGAESVK